MCTSHNGCSSWCPTNGVKTRAHGTASSTQPALRRIAEFPPSRKINTLTNKKHLKYVGPIRHCEPPHALILHCHSPGVATVARRLRIDVHDNDNDNDNNNDNAWQRGPLWPHRMGPINEEIEDSRVRPRRPPTPPRRGHCQLWAV